MDTKERAISDIMHRMSIALSAMQSDQLLSVLTTVLQEYTLEPQTTLPSVEVDDTQQLIGHYLAAKRLEGCLPNTLNHYKYTLSRFAMVVDRDLKLIDTNTIRCYLGCLSQGNQNSYVDGIRRELNSFYVWMEAEDYVQKNPCRKIKRIKCEKKMEMPYTDEEIVKIQDACQTPKETAFVDLLMSTGIRREEVTKIRLSDISWDSRSIKIYGKGAKQRIVYFSARCKRHLQVYLDSRDYESEYLFSVDRGTVHGQLSVSALHKYVKRIGEKAKVAHVHLHRFRKWFGTSMADKGVDIRDLKELMGHSKLDTTNEYYIYANLRRIQAEHQRYAT